MFTQTQICIPCIPEVIQKMTWATEKDRKEFSDTEKDFYLPFLYYKTYVLEFLI